MTTHDPTTRIALAPADPSPAPSSQMFQNQPFSTLQNVTPEVAQPNPIPALTARQLTATRLLVTGHKQKSIAAHLKIERHTLARWQKLPAFQTELHRLHVEAFQFQLIPRRPPQPRSRNY